ncbi:efflux RND transporter periplasmic adaptor subunit, partial [Bacteroidales bacterium AH-315-I05]|nr:efflux RND transporter periplasmic adaptor subunit [Bacteroidales bacterium AH-315-I05]
KARLAQVKAKMINAEADFSRNEKLFNQGAISQADFDAAKSAFEVAKAEVEAAEQNVIGSEFSVKSAEASLKEAQNNLLKTTIFSPVEGTVSMLNVEQGERVVGTSQMAGTEMMRIADLSTMEANVEVNENDIVKVNLGDKVEIEVDAYLGRKFKGIVMEMANSANREGMNVDQVTTFDVKIRILRESYEDLVSKENPHLSPFRPGMTATVEIQTEIAYDVLTVPIQTVTTREDSAGVDEKSGVTEKDREAENREEKDEEIVECVFVLKDDSAKKVEVKTGIQDSKHIEILSGLEEGQEVISGPYSAISKELIDGDLVEKTEKKDLFKKRRKRQ